MLLPARWTDRSGPAGVWRIALVGYRGSGKSTVGRRLAERLGWRFVDTDGLVEQSAGDAIPTIFARDGEAAFRRLETDALARALTHPQAVIATGGGIVLSPTNRVLLRRAFTVWLNAPARELAARIAADTANDRPALMGASAIAEVDMVLGLRRPLYAMVADVRLDATSPVGGLVDSIVRAARPR